MSPRIDPSKAAARAVRLRAKNPEWGYKRIADEMGWDRHHVRRVIEHAERKTTLPATRLQSGVDFYETACRALAQAKTVDEAKEGMDGSEAIRVYAHRAKNYQLEADAYAVREGYERKLGLMLTAAKNVDQVKVGRPPKNCSAEELFPRVRLEDYGIDRKLSMRAQKKGGIAERAFEAMVARKRAEIAEGHRVPDILKEAGADGKKRARDAREAALGAVQCALPDAKFGIIVADPEWRFEPWSRETGMDRAADNHYPTSCTEVIAARDVPSIAAEDCVLFLWATIPMLPHALTVMAAWGFDYKSHLVWEKDKIGNGYWVREKHELWLMGTRGSPPALAMGTQAESVIQAPRRGHSQKPEQFLEMIERWYPTMPKIELNRIGPPRDGWAAWGNQVEAAA